MHSEHVLSTTPARSVGPARLVYLGGLGRSGSTLIERLLGELPGVCPAGEVLHLWRRGVMAGERCGCGTPFPDCPFWRRVGQTSFGGWDQIDLDRLLALQRKVDRMRFVPLLAAPALPSAFKRDLLAYLAYYVRLYQGISEVSDGQVVLDSSKQASLAACLRWSDAIDLRVVHVVRDSRAVAYSWTRQVSRPDSLARSVMTTYSPASAAARWNMQNSALHLLASRGVPTLRVRYEDFVGDPEASLTEIADFMGTPLPAAGSRFVGGDPADRWANLSTAHTVAGNPMRFRTGQIAIRPDDRWRDAMPAGQQHVVTALTFPLLARYGYLRDETRYRRRHRPESASPGSGHDRSGPATIRQHEIRGEHNR